MTNREQQLLRWIEEDPMISQEELAQRAGIARSSVAVHITNLIKKGYLVGKGYILRQAPYCVVVGGINMDITGKSAEPLVAADSNPGYVTMTLGGVGRNIAHNLRLMEADVRMLTAVGADANGQRAMESCRSLGMDMSRALQLSDCTTSTYLCICQPEGDMEVAISDMAICDRITPEYLAANKAVLQGAAIVVVDCNVPEETIRYLAENITVPIYADPVSTHKAKKLLPVLGKLHTLKPNAIEAEILSGVPIRSDEDLPKAADALLGTGLQRVFISLGSGGVYCADRQQKLHLKNLPGDMVNTTGCGDSFMAALVRAGMSGLSLQESGTLGLAAAGITMEYTGAINPRMNCDALMQRSDIQLPALPTNKN